MAGRLLLRVATSVHDSSGALEMVLRVAAEQLTDVIVVGVHGRSAFDRLVFGSTTEHILRRARCPVLAVPAPDGP
jgi:nucleotide-binding universal stress UspA family protein